MFFSKRAEQLILLGAEAIREQGRKEVRQQVAAQVRRERELDDMALRLTSDHHLTNEAHRVSVHFLLMECLRQATYQCYMGTIRDEKSGGFSMVLTGLTASELADVKTLAAKLMADVEERHRT